MTADIIPFDAKPRATATRKTETTVDIINSLSAHQKAALADQLRMEALRTNLIS